jgi:DNA-binding CsgD family transcriptional regulator
MGWLADRFARQSRLEGEAATIVARWAERNRVASGVAAMTPRRIAERLESGNLAACVPGVDTETLLSRIAALTRRERLLLGLEAEGWSRQEISEYTFVALETVTLALRRIFKRLRGEEVTTEPVARAAMVWELFVDDEATPEEAVAVKEAFSRAGFPATVRRGLSWSGEGEQPWGVVVTLGVPIPTFFDAFATEGANDAYPAVKAWAKEIFEARGSERRRGEILLHGRRNGTIALWSDMPEAALDSLAEIDWGGERDAQGASVPFDKLEAEFLSFPLGLTSYDFAHIDQDGYFTWSAEQSEWIDQFQPHGSPFRWAWSNRFLAPLIAVVVAGLAGLRRRRRAD